MDSLEHLGDQFDLSARSDGKDVAIKMNDTALVLCFGIDFSHSFEHS